MAAAILRYQHHVHNYVNNCGRDLNVGSIPMFKRIRNLLKVLLMDVNKKHVLVGKERVYDQGYKHFYACVIGLLASSI